MRREGKGTLKKRRKKKIKKKTGCSGEQLFILGHGVVIGCLARAWCERGRFERVPGWGEQGLAVPLGRGGGRWGLEPIRGTGVKRGPSARAVAAEAGGEGMRWGR